MFFPKNVQIGQGQNGHWAANYFGRGGVINRDRQAYFLARMGEDIKETLISGLQYASTLYSARVYNPFIGFRLSKVIGEIEPYFEEVGLSWPQKEVLVAIYEHLRSHDVYWTGETKNQGKALALGKQILRGDNVPFPTFLLAKARLSRLKGVNRIYRIYYKEYVVVELKKLVADNVLFKQRLGGDWKTVCRLGRLVGAWELVEIALSLDRSRDLHIKSWVCPGYLAYKLNKAVFGW